MKKHLALLLALMMIVALCACGSSSAPTVGGDAAKTEAPAESSGAPKTEMPSEAEKPDGKTYTWRIGIGNGGGEGNPVIYYANRVAEKAAELSDGRLIVEVYPGGTLGTNAEIPQGLIDGTVDSGILPTQFFTSTVSDLYVMDMTGYFESVDQAISFLDQNETIKTHAQDKGIYIASYLKLYPRCTITVKPIERVSDLKAQKLWFATSAMLSNKCTSVGAIPCNFPGSDLAVSIQNSTVDGAWCDMSMMNNFCLYDFAKNVMTAPGDPMCSVFCISDFWLQTLPEDLKDVVFEAAADCQQMEWDKVVEIEAQLRQNLVDNGCIITEPSDEFVADFKAAIGDEAAFLLKEHPETETVYNELLKFLGR